MTTSTRQGTADFSKFIQLIKEWIQKLGLNGQLFVEIIQDEALPLPARTLAVGVLLYLKLPIDLISDKLKWLGLIDDILIMITGLALIVRLMSEERLAYYRQKYEAVTKIDEYEQILRSILGMLWERLIQYVETLQNRTYKQRTTEDVAQSAELRETLFDETMVYVAELNLDPATLDDDPKLLMSPEKVMGLLASGLEEAQKEQEASESLAGKSMSAFKRILLGGRGISESQS